MSKHAGQRRAPRSPRVPALGWVAVAIALGLSAVTVVAMVANPDDGSASVQDDASADAVDNDGDGRELCADAATVAVASAYLDAWNQIATTFRPDEPCVSFDMVAVASPAIALGDGPDVDAWIPEDASWIARTARSVWKGSSVPAGTPIARTPVVVATTAELDDSVGGVQQLLTPAVLGPLARGHQDVRRLRIRDCRGSADRPARPRQLSDRVPRVRSARPGRVRSAIGRCPVLRRPEPRRPHGDQGRASRGVGGSR